MFNTYLESLASAKARSYDGLDLPQGTALSMDCTPYQSFTTACSMLSKMTTGLLEYVTPSESFTSMGKGTDVLGLVSRMQPDQETSTMPDYRSNLVRDSPSEMSRLKIYKATEDQKLQFNDITGLLGLVKVSLTVEEGIRFSISYSEDDESPCKVVLNVEERVALALTCTEQPASAQDSGDIQPNCTEQLPTKSYSQQNAYKGELLPDVQLLPVEQTPGQGPCSLTITPQEELKVNISYTDDGDAPCKLGLTVVERLAVRIHCDEELPASSPIADVGVDQASANGKPKRKRLLSGLKKKIGRLLGCFTGCYYAPKA